MRILLVEAETKMAKALARGLEQEHYEIVPGANGEDAFSPASTQKFDLMLLDLGLPRRSGLDVLRALRQNRTDLPVLILTARDSVESLVEGLDARADDYLVKPFAFPELLARIRALTRRGRSEQALRLKVGELEMDCVTRRVTRQGATEGQISFFCVAISCATKDGRREENTLARPVSFEHNWDDTTKSSGGLSRAASSGRHP